MGAEKKGGGRGFVCILSCYALWLIYDVKVMVTTLAGGACYFKRYSDAQIFCL